MELAKRYLVTLILALLTCCSRADAPDQVPDCSRFRCDADAVAFAPEGALIAVTDSALKRFRAATGRDDLRIEDGGVPVLFREHILPAKPELDEAGNPKEVCALTTAVSLNGGRNYAQRIEIDPTPPPFCPDAGLSILHELIHALAPDVDHAERGLFAPSIGGPTIDEPAMVQLCTEFDCQEFVPEP
jgi:hypothetical protein